MLNQKIMLEMPAPLLLPKYWCDLNHRYKEQQYDSVYSEPVKIHRITPWPNPNNQVVDQHEAAF